MEKEFYRSGRVSDFHKWLERHIDSNRIAADLTGLMKKPFRHDAVNVYLTTFHRAPYDPDEPSFLLFEQPRREQCITTVYHEMAHFLFHWYYWQECRESGLSENEIDDFKESLTILLNPILQKRKLPLDGGYPLHKEIRKHWGEVFAEDPDFPVFLKKALAIYKTLQRRDPIC